SSRTVPQARSLTYGPQVRHAFPSARSRACSAVRAAPLLVAAAIVVASAIGAEPGIERHAAVDVERVAGHVVGVVRRQPHRRLADVGDDADAAVWNQGQEAVLRVRRLPRAAI